MAIDCFFNSSLICTFVANKLNPLIIMKIIFATNNEHKLREIRQILGTEFDIRSLKEIACTEDIPENEPTIEGNASFKALYVFRNYKRNCFADDTGLEIDALNGRPGVHSARYAGTDRDFEANIQKVLSELHGIDNRKARFKTIISFIEDGTETQFEGIVEGEILREKRGAEGFGYDPIFRPLGFETSFAEMSEKEKNAISHRAIAVKKFATFLKQKTKEQWS